MIGTTWPLQVTLLTGDKQPVEGIKPKEGTTGWSDTWMIASNASNPNCMYLWMDHMMAPKTQATVAEGFGEAPANLKACELTKNPNHCDDVPRRRPGLVGGRLLLGYADRGLRRRGRHVRDAGGLAERLDGDPGLGASHLARAGGPS